DIVEIDAGDTYAYDEEGQKTQQAREQAGAERIFGILPEDKGKYLYDLWQEFEKAETPEAKFAHAMDNIQPLMLNDHTDGKAWREHGVHLEQVLNRQKKTAEGSQILFEYAVDNLIMPNAVSGALKVES
ncbi:MAG: HD domain-containing protein, partial [Clostridia bacterium]|nr:HD domain-containing protein [Clostridia bacterium]